MFFKMIVSSGYMFAWIGLFTVMTFILKGFIKKVDDANNDVRIDTYYKGLLGTFSLNLMISLVIVYTLVLLAFDVVHWLWVMLGVITTFVVYIVTVNFVKLGRSILEHELTDKEKKSMETWGINDVKKKMRGKQQEYWSMFVLNIIVYAVIALNAWDIVPIHEKLFPPMMPIYLHMSFDWIQIAFIFLMNFSLIIIYREWMRVKKMEHYLLNKHKEVKKEKVSGNTQ